MSDTMDILGDNARHMMNKTISEQIEDGAIGQTPSIKLIKNSKGYNWEIKILELDPDKIMRINNEMFQRFGGSE